ncbi:MAG TPA: hypothetical protein VE983_01730 [Solirubrobacteraceae bacterium]|nr:hypothetical protein [Solirubrobacteraceae bacterium]
MSFLDKAKAAAEQARIRAQEGLEEVQTRRDLAQAYWNLGHKTYELANAGAISHPELDPLIAQIGELESREGGGGGPQAAAT